MQLGNHLKDKFSEKNITSNKDVKQYLTFFIDGEEYGVNILKVVEIRGWERPTPLPTMPAYIKGVVNLRGDIVPIIDMRERFNLSIKEYTALTVVIMLQIEVKDNYHIIGIVADTISDVYTFNENEVHAAPHATCALDAHFVEGLASVNDKMVIILDSDNLIDLTQLEQLKQ